MKIAALVLGLVLAEASSGRSVHSRAQAYEKAHPGVARVGGKVKAPVRVSGDQPSIPDELSQKYRVGETMILEAVIDERGNVVDPIFLSDTQKDLQPYVLMALKTWKYQPAAANGKPLAVFLTVTVNICIR
jgi:hypothetical protein